jgi:hypothetical protein
VAVPAAEISETADPELAMTIILRIFENGLTSWQCAVAAFGSDPSYWIECIWKRNGDSTGHSQHFIYHSKHARTMTVWDHTWTAGRKRFFQETMRHRI